MSGDEVARGVGDDLMDKVVNLCKRRGFVYQSAEIYGGFRSAYDYGPLGVLLLRNVKDAWWRTMVQLRTDVVGLDASILSPPEVWEASGHLTNFTDPLVDCRSCGVRHREDQLDDPEECPDCGERGQFTEAREFNLMFRTQAGPVADAGAEVYLRPETAQGMFINFANVLNTIRKKPPFGIAQIGKSFRNEITPGNFIFRTREFEQMEMEFFVPPEEAAGWFEYWCGARMDWYTELGIPADKLRLRPHDADELSHYSAGTADVEYLFPWGWGELEGIANRTDYDLTQHAQHSGVDLDYYDQQADERYRPHVIEPAAGATRTMMAFLLAAYDTEEVRGESPHGAAPASSARPLQGGGAAPVQEARSPSGVRGGAGSAPAPVDDRLRRDPVHRASLSPPRRDRHPLLRDRGLRHPGRPGRHRAGPRHHGPRPGAHRRSCGAPGRQARPVRWWPIWRPLGRSVGR